jgi:cation diffusion facilitator CzcD-associated flavoprotein CzcO
MLTTDYLIIGSGAAGMSFADQLLTETNANTVIVDRHHLPGGHWNDAYSFVRLHAPSAFYGVGSRQLGSNRLDVSGFNRGYYEIGLWRGDRQLFRQADARTFSAFGPRPVFSDV